MYLSERRLLSSALSASARLPSSKTMSDTPCFHLYAHTNINTIHGKKTLNEPLRIDGGLRVLLVTPAFHNLHVATPQRVHMNQEMNRLYLYHEPISAMCCSSGCTFNS